jgi:hypothetical protein
MFFISLPFSDAVYVVYMLLTWIYLVFGIAGNIQQKVTQEQSVSHQLTICSVQYPAATTNVQVLSIFQADNRIVATGVETQRNHYQANYSSSYKHFENFKPSLNEGFGLISVNRGPPRFC